MDIPDMDSWDCDTVLWVTPVTGKRLHLLTQSSVGAEPIALCKELPFRSGAKWGQGIEEIPDECGDRAWCPKCMKFVEGNPILTVHMSPQ